MQESLRIKIKLWKIIQKQKMGKKSVGNTTRESLGEKSYCNSFSYLFTTGKEFVQNIYI